MKKTLKNPSTIALLKYNPEVFERVYPEIEKLVWFAIHKYVGSRIKNERVDPEDIYQIGLIGFLKAVRNYDPSRGVEFNSYAVPMIAGEVMRFLRDNVSPITVTRSVHDRLVEVRKAQEELYQILGREPTSLDIAERTGLTVFEVEEAMQADLISYLGDIVEDDERNPIYLADCIATATNVEDEVIEKVAFEQALSRFDEHTRKIVQLRLAGMSQPKIAKIIGLSQASVSRRLLKLTGGIRLVDIKVKRKYEFGKYDKHVEVLVEHARAGKILTYEEMREIWEEAGLPKVPSNMHYSIRERAFRRIGLKPPALEKKKSYIRRARTVETKPVGVEKVLEEAKVEPIVLAVDKLTDGEQAAKLFTAIAQFVTVMNDRLRVKVTITGVA